MATPRHSVPSARAVHIRNGLLAALFVMLIIAGLLPTSAAPTVVGNTYLALGDSLTTGTEAILNNDGKPGYPDYLYNLLKGARDLQLKGLGVDGETTASMLATGGQLEQAVAFIEQERAAGRVVSPVTLDIGGNDMVAVLQGQASVDEALTIFRANFGTILDTLVAALTVNGERTGDLAVMTYYNPYPNITLNPPGSPSFPIAFPIDTNRDIQRFNAIILEEAAKRGIAVAPVAERFAGKESQYIFANFFAYNSSLPVSNPANQAALDYHPKEAGHQAIAAAFFQTLTGQAPPVTPTPVIPTATPLVLTTKDYLPIVVK